MATPNAKLAGRPDRHARDRAIMVARHLAARGADRARALWLPRAVALRPVRYGRMALSRGYAVCEKPVADALLDLLKKRLDYLIKDGEGDDFVHVLRLFRIDANAVVVDVGAGLGGDQSGVWWTSVLPFSASRNRVAADHPNSIAKIVYGGAVYQTLLAASSALS